jgi:hypothetical protein
MFNRGKDPVRARYALFGKRIESIKSRAKADNQKRKKGREWLKKEAIKNGSLPAFYVIWFPVFK